MSGTYIHIDSADCTEKLAQSIKEQLQSIDKAYDEICVACIGTDRAMGDCLGPLVGYKLNGVEGIKVRGTLNDTLHAMNLKKYIDSISSNQLVIAIDACLGRMERVGHIVVDKGSINPGSGVDKKLPPIGDISITGIVNFGGCAEYLVLQNTRLSLVMKMADAIANSLEIALIDKSIEAI
jgi:putative sporulation protein YyaC